MGPISNISSILNFPKLNGNNYYAWSDNMMSALQVRLLWLIVDGQQPSPLNLLLVLLLMPPPSHLSLSLLLSTKHGSAYKTNICSS